MRILPDTAKEVKVMKYVYYTECCAVCGKRSPKRDMNKIYLAYGHTSVPSPKIMCSVCDDCLPALCEFLEVNAPDDTVHWRPSPKSCNKCFKYSKADALFS